LHGKDLPTLSVRCLLLVISVLPLAIGCGTDKPVGDGASSAADLILADRVYFTTADTFRIGATWYRPNRQAGRQPALILLHMFNGDRTDWITLTPDLVPALVANGYLVLAIDMRGHGESTLRNGRLRRLSALNLVEINNMPLDVEAALRWLRSRSTVDPERIAVIGADIGANVAFISSGLYGDIKTTVTLSPFLRSGQELLSPDAIPDFEPRSVLFLASFGDGYAFTSAEAMAAQTRDPVRVEAYQGSAHGIFLLVDRSARDAVFGWLRETL
jgi:pimeloyl-ACP methyl ester carboxylesterase